MHGETIFGLLQRQSILRFYRHDIHPAGPQPMADNNAIGELFYPHKSLRAGTKAGYDQYQNDTDINQIDHFRSPNATDRIQLQTQYTILV